MRCPVGGIKRIVKGQIFYHQRKISKLLFWSLALGSAIALTKDQRSKPGLLNIFTIVILPFFNQIFLSRNVLLTENSQDSNIFFCPYTTILFVTIIAKRKYFTHVFLNHRCLDVIEYVNTDVYFTRLQVFHSIVCHHQTNSSL